MIVLSGLSLAGIVGSFYLAQSDLEMSIKTGILSVMVVFFGAAFIATLMRARSQAAGPAVSEPLTTDADLLALDDAHALFRNTLGSGDAFRLVCSRVNRMIPFDTALLLTPDDEGDGLSIARRFGVGAENISNREGKAAESLASRAFREGKLIRGRATSLEFPNAVAVPLVNAGGVFAVFQMMAASEDAFAVNSDQTFKSVAERTAPLIRASMSVDQSMSSSYTDLITNLPNERAFFLILDNQLAEASRNRSDRTVSVLAVDVKNFDEINSKYGHVIGDRFLNNLAGRIKDQLRQMDFFARSAGDEFLAILPTASAEVALDIAGRLSSSMIGYRIMINETESVDADIYVGYATYDADGDTSSKLLASARTRRDQSKGSEPPRVVWFSREYVN